MTLLPNIVLWASMVSVKRENGFVWWTDASGFHNVKSHFVIHCSWAVPAPQMRMVSRQSAPFRNFVVSATWHAVCGLNRFKLYRRNRVGITHCSASFCVVFCGFVPREGTAVFPRQSILSPNPIPLVPPHFSASLLTCTQRITWAEVCILSQHAHCDTGDGLLLVQQRVHGFLRMFRISFHFWLCCSIADCMHGRTVVQQMCSFIGIFA